MAKKKRRAPRQESPFSSQFRDQMMKDAQRESDERWTTLEEDLRQAVSTVQGKNKEEKSHR